MEATNNSLQRLTQSKRQVNCVVAFRPRTIANTKSPTNIFSFKILANVAEVVAERRFLTTFTHVIRIHPRECIRNHLTQVAHVRSSDTRRRDRGLAQFDRCLAERHSCLHCGMDKPVHRWLMMIRGHRHIRVILILDSRCGKSISNGHAFQVDQHTVARRLLVSLPYLVGHGWNVVSSIRLSNLQIQWSIKMYSIFWTCFKALGREDEGIYREEVVLLVFRVSLEELLQEVVHIICHLLLIMVKA